MYLLVHLFEKIGERARDDSVGDILINTLGMYPKEIEVNIYDVYATTKNDTILWIVTSDLFVKKVF